MLQFLHHPLGSAWLLVASDLGFRDLLFTGGQHTVCMCIHINTIEFVMKINDSVKGMLTSRANCPLAAFCSSA